MIKRKHYKRGVRKEGKAVEAMLGKFRRARESVGWWVHFLTKADYVTDHEKNNSYTLAEIATKELGVYVSPGMLDAAMKRAGFTSEDCVWIPGSRAYNIDEEFFSSLDQISDPT